MTTSFPFCPKPKTDVRRHKKDRGGRCPGVAAWFGSGALGFPHVFQAMFVAYVAWAWPCSPVGCPPMEEAVGVTAVRPWWFYLVLSAFISGARRRGRNTIRRSKRADRKGSETQACPGPG